MSSAKMAAILSRGRDELNAYIVISSNIAFLVILHCLEKLLEDAAAGSDLFHDDFKVFSTESGKTSMMQN